MRWRNLHLEWKTLHSCSQEKRSGIGKQQQKPSIHLEAQERVFAFWTHLPQHVNHLTGKNTGLTQLESASRPRWGPCLLWPLHSPCTLLPSSFLTVEKQEGILLIRTTGATLKTTSDFDLFWAWKMVQGSRSSSWSDWEADERQDLWKMNSPLAFDTGLYSDLEHVRLKKITPVPPKPLWGCSPCDSETAGASAGKGACPRLRVSGTWIGTFWLPGRCHPPVISLQQRFGTQGSVAQGGIS